MRSIDIIKYLFIVQSIVVKMYFFWKQGHWLHWLLAVICAQVKVTFTLPPKFPTFLALDRCSVARHKRGSSLFSPGLTAAIYRYVFVWWSLDKKLHRNFIFCRTMTSAYLVKCGKRCRKLLEWIDLKRDFVFSWTKIAAAPEIARVSEARLRLHREGLTSRSSSSSSAINSCIRVSSSLRLRSRATLQLLQVSVASFRAIEIVLYR